MKHADLRNRHTRLSPSERPAGGAGQCWHVISGTVAAVKGIAAEWWLDPIADHLREQAVAAVEAGDVNGFLLSTANDYGLHLVFYNRRRLLARGLYEPALLRAFTVTRTNHRSWPLWIIRKMFQDADRTKLLACGDPLPEPGPFTLFRGVALGGAARRVRGLSWTGARPIAAWFANRFSHHGDPAVFQVTVGEAAICAYVDSGEYGRHEQEFIVDLEAGPRPRRVLAGAALKAEAEEHLRQRRERKATGA